MMTRDDKCAVISALRKRHRLLAAFLEAADKIGHSRLVIPEIAKVAEAPASEASALPLPQVERPPVLAFALRRANLVAVTGSNHSAEA